MTVEQVDAWNDKDVGLMKDYKAMKKRVLGHLMFYRVGDFYEMYFDEALLGSQLLDLKLTKYNRHKEIPMAGFQHFSVVKNLKIVLEHGISVALIKQTSGATGKGRIVREISKIVTPGTVVDYDILARELNNYLCYIYMGKNDTYSIAYTDVSTGEFMVTEFEGSSRLIDEVTRINPVEIKCNTEFMESEVKVKLEQRTGVDVCEFYDASFTRSFMQNVIEEYYGLQSIKVLGFGDCKYVSLSVGVTLMYLRDVFRDEEVKLSRVKFYNVTDYMLIDSASRKNLELVNNSKFGRRGTLFSVLNKAKTNMGSRQLSKWIEAPLLNKSEIEKRQAAVTELYEDNEKLDDIRSVLVDISDYERIVNRLVYDTFSIQDVIILKKSIELLTDLKRLLDGMDSNYLVELSELGEFRQVIDYLNEVIDEDEEALQVAYFPSLAECYSLNQDSAKIISDMQEREIEVTGIPQLRITEVSVREGKYRIEIPKTRIVDGSIPEHYKEDMSVKAKSRYITDELLVLEDKIRNSNALIEKLTKDAENDIKDFLRQHIDEIKASAYCVGVVDVLATLAKVAVDNRYCLPVIYEHNFIKIVDGRHPVVEHFTDGHYVANNTNISTDKNMISILTGSNMSGKSTYMRQVALITLMAQMGSYVPAKAAHIGLVDTIFTRVGASDSLVTGESTFMVEMNEVANILNSATPRSLVILDEVGRGTSTTDGMAIAKAVLNYMLNKVKAKTLFATHYHELTEFADACDLVTNYCVIVEEDGEDLVITHKIHKGTSNNSYGIQIAKLAGLPPEVVREAKENLKVLNGN